MNYTEITEMFVTKNFLTVHLSTGLGSFKIMKLMMMNHESQFNHKNFLLSLKFGAIR